MNLVLYTSWPDRGPIREQWNALLATTLSNNIFLTWEWLRAWWNYEGHGKGLCLLAGWRGGELCGVAPFYVEKVRYYGRLFRRIRFIGDGSNDSDYLDCFAQTGSEQELLEEVFHFLSERRSEWDYLDLEGPPQGSACLSALLAIAERRSWRSELHPIPCTTLPLANSWGDYLKSLRPRFRTKLKSTLSFFDNQRGCRLEQCGLSDVEDWLETLFELHTRRWTQRNLPGVFRNSRRRRFYTEIARSTLNCGWLAFHRLSWGERALALQFGFTYNGRFYLLQEGYDPDFDFIRPGIALRGMLIRDHIASGMMEYDFLAGTSQSKMDWGAKQKMSTHLVLAPPGPSARALVDLPRVGKELKEIIRENTPPTVLSLRRKIYQSWSARGWTKPSQDNGSKPELVKMVSAQLHGKTPLGTIMRRLAGRYELAPVAGSWRRELRARQHSMCHIFMYHAVNSENDPFLPATPVTAFRQQMEYLAKHFPIISLDQVARGEAAAADGGYSVAITFDDGYRDNFVHAYPILRALNIPATIFLVSGCIESGQMTWYDRVRLAFKLSCVSHFSLRDCGGPEQSLNTVQARVQACGETLWWLRSVSEERRQGYLRNVFHALRVEEDLTLPNFMLTWDDVRQMSSGRIRFGAHTASHPVLSKLSKSQLRDEIVGCKATIEDRLQMPVVHFAYPFGRPQDFNEESKRVVQEAGFKSAATTVLGFNVPDQDRFELKRFCPWETDASMFALKLDWYRLMGVQPVMSQEGARETPTPRVAVR